MNARVDEKLWDKYNEAFSLLPTLFMQAGFDTFAENIPFGECRNIKGHENKSDTITIHGMRQTKLKQTIPAVWLKANQLEAFSVQDLLLNRMIRYSFFKAVPAALKMFVYDNGEWLTADNIDEDEKQKTAHVLTLDTIKSYAVLDYLPRVTGAVDAANGSFIWLTSDLTHEPAFLQAPDYVPVENVTGYGGSPFAYNPAYHVNMAAFLLLEKWFAYLKEIDVYDTTRIIIVSDHGSASAYDSSTFKGVQLPDGGALSSFHPVLLVKDFKAEAENVPHELVTDSSFMTNADVCLIALDGIIENPVNPFTSRPIVPDKQNGVYITTAERSTTEYQYSINEKSWLYVHDDVFNPDNWQRLSP